MENLKPGSGMVDVAVIGGGPAGTAAALEARRQGLSTAIWERERFPRDKVCGEFISPEALPWLKSEIPEIVVCGAEIRDAEFISAHGGSRTFHLPHRALGLSRRLLDHALWKAAEGAGAEAREGESVRKVRMLASCGKERDVWEIESAGGSVQRSRSLMVACGRWWAIEGLSSPARQDASQVPGDWIGAKAHLAGIPPRDRVEMYFFRGGYCGLAPVEHGACNVCCLVRRERIRETGAKGIEDFVAWLAQVARLPALEKRLRGALKASPVVTTAPVHLARRHAALRGVLMVGDASGFLDPFTGEGISMALHSGRLAAQAVAKSLSEGSGDERAAAIYEQSLSQAVGRSYKIAGIARGLLHGPLWLQGLVTAPLPWIGKRLVSETRWRGNTEVTPG
ncbi:MAG TPA: FAD-dependent oxidoreductase [Terriglobia bacterium]|nr:FAD-dependent oxidoreductase [Terriglobia bacterium]